MADLIQIRRDKASVWSSVNPVLGLAEIGIVLDESGNITDPIQFKVGNGSSNWNNLVMQVAGVSGSHTSNNTFAYSDANGHIIDSGVSLVQATGSSQSAVMNQKSVTDGLNTKVNKSDFIMSTEAAVRAIVSSYVEES